MSGSQFEAEDDSPEALRLFEEFLATDPAQDAVHALCAAHPEHAATFAVLWQDYQLARKSLQPTDAPESEALLRLLHEMAGDRVFDLHDTGRLGRGGMSVVDGVFDPRLGRHLARKALPIDTRRASLRPDECRRLRRFLAEVRTAARLQHSAILTIIDFGIDPKGRPCFTMPIVKGRDFGSVITAVQNGDETWNLARALQVLIEVCDAVAYAHERGVIHRDLKPANIMVSRFGETFVVDWGVAKVVVDAGTSGSAADSSAGPIAPALDDGDTDTALTLAGDVVGTPAFMAPEQASGDARRVSTLCDQYSLGATLYCLLTGTHPYAHPEAPTDAQTLIAAIRRGPPTPIVEIAPNVPAELVAICERAMARDPARRYADMRALAADLRAFLEVRVVSAYQTGAIATLRKWIRRNRGFAIAIAAALVAVVGGLAAVALSEANSRAVLETNNAALRREDYVANVLLANTMLHEGSPSREVAARLERCEPALRNFEWHYLHRVKDTTLATFDSGVRGTIQSMAVSPDESRIALAMSFVKVFALDSGTELSHVALGVPVDGMAFTPDNRFVAAGCRDGSVRLLDLVAGSVREVYRFDGGGVSAVGFADGGGMLVAGDPRGRVHLYDVAQANEVAVIDAHAHAVRRLAVSPDERVLASGDVAGGVRLSRIAERRAVHAVQVGKLPITLLRFHHSGNTLYASDTAVRFAPIDVATGTAGAMVGCSGYEAEGQDTDPEGKYLFYGHNCGLRVYELESVVLVAEGFGHDAPIVHVRHLSRSNGLLTSGRDGTVRLWHRTRGQVWQHREMGAIIDRIAWAPDGRQLAIATRSGVDVLNAGDRSQIAHLDPNVGRIRSMAYSPDGRWLAFLGDRDGLAVADAADPRTLRRVDGPFAAASALVFGAGPRILVPSPRARTLVSVDPTTMDQQSLALEQAARVLAIDVDGRVYVVSDEGTCWCVDDRLRLQWSRSVPSVAGSAMTCLAVSHGLLAIGAGDGSIQLVDGRDGTPRAMSYHTAVVTDLRFDASGSRLFSVGGDGVLRVSAPDGRQLLVLAADRNPLHSVAIAPDGRAVAVGGQFGMLHEWLLDPD